MNIKDKITGGDQLTEREVLAAARSINELGSLRRMKDADTNGSLTIQGATYPLTPDEVTAVLGLLIERHSTLLVGLNIRLDQPSQ